MEISFNGKRALVTGAAQGIGLAIAKKLAACGAQILGLDIQEEKLEEAMKEIPGAEWVSVDLGDWESTEKSLKSIGRVDLVVNNAGVGGDIDRMLSVNLKGLMVVCKHVVNEWTTEGTRGAIVNIASALAVRPSLRVSGYAATKAAIVQYTRCLALDCAPKGIRVSAISPGIVNTEMSKKTTEHPVGMEYINRTVPMPEKILEPEDIANAVAFLLCDKVAGRITGVNLYVDAGLMLT